VSFGQPPSGPPAWNDYAAPYGQPPAGGALPPPSPGFGPSGPQPDPLAIVSVILGAFGLLGSFISLCCCLGWASLPLGIAGAVLGFVSLSRQNAHPELYTGRPLALTGIGLGIAAVLVAGGMIGLSFAMNLGMASLENNPWGY
jgi:hypothetical protein